MSVKAFARMLRVPQHDILLFIVYAGKRKIKNRQIPVGHTGV